jgi:hypothetical protein
MDYSKSDFSMQNETIMLDDLIEKFKSLENQEAEMLLSIDEGKTTYPLTSPGWRRRGYSFCFSFFSGSLGSWVYPETGLPKRTIPMHEVSKKSIAYLISVMKMDEHKGYVTEVSVDSEDHCYPLVRIEERKGFYVLIGDSSKGVADGVKANEYWQKSKQRVKDFIGAMQLPEERGIEDFHLLISIDGGKTTRPISRIKIDDEGCKLIFDHYKWLRSISPASGVHKPGTPRFLAEAKFIDKVLRKLRSSLNQNGKMKISIDEGESSYPIHKMECRGNSCVLIYFPNTASELTAAHKKWITGDKKIPDLVRALRTFKNQKTEVLLSVDGGNTCKPIYLVNSDGYLGSFAEIYSEDCFWEDHVSPSTGFPFDGTQEPWNSMTISELIRRLRTDEDTQKILPYKDLDREVRISGDNQNHYYPISRIAHRGNHCILIYDPDPQYEIIKAQRIWSRSKKSGTDLIKALRSFYYQNQQVLISVDGGKTTRPINTIKNGDDHCLFQFCDQEWLQYLDPKTKFPKAALPEAVSRGHMIPQLIDALKRSKDKNQDARISIDGGVTHYPISRIDHRSIFCILIFDPDDK